MLPSYGGELVYYDHDDLRITSARIEYGNTTYATSYIYAIEKTFQKAGKPWSILWASGGAACFLFFISTIADNPVLGWICFIISISLFLAARRSFLTNIPYYGIRIKMSAQEPVEIWFGDDEADRNDAYRAIGEAIAFWHTNEGTNRETVWQTRMERFHSEDD
jgi:hypothetical protein